MPPVQENEGTEQGPESDKISGSESTRTRPLPPESAFYGALAAVEHPELEGHNLVELGMIPAIVQEPFVCCFQRTGPNAPFGPNDILPHLGRRERGRWFSRM